MAEEHFYELGCSYANHNMKLSKATGIRRFQSFFGITPDVCAIVWNSISALGLHCGAEPKHLLWALNFLKQYTVEHTRHVIFNADEKTIRKWTWKFVKLLSSLNAVQWERRHELANINQTCFNSLDGIDFKIMEPSPFSNRWYSHKFKAAGIRYEIGLCIATGNVVWANGGYPCGEYPDLKIARESYCLMVEPGEKTMADLGYKDENFFILPNERNKNIHRKIMSRHETVNKRIRQFKILKDCYRHSLKSHPTIFHSVVNLTQLMIENGYPLYNI